MFVPTGLLGGEGFWWDLLAVDGEPLEPAVRDHVLEQLQGDGSRAVAWAREQGHPIADLPGHALPLTENELLDLESEGLTLGAHTVSHANLPVLAESEVRNELLESRRWLEQRTSRYVDWLAYPYGQYDDRVARVAGEVFEGALRVDGGLIVRSKPTPPHRVPRINVPRGLTPDGLLLRLSGLIG